MNSSQLYLNLHQILADREGKNSLLYAERSDYFRPIHVAVARNSGYTRQGEYSRPMDNSSMGVISHLTLEFKGPLAKFFCCLVFDGSGDHGIGLAGFAMPKRKLTMQQKSLALLSVLDYLTSAGLLNVTFSYFMERVSNELDGGIISLQGRYSVLCRNSDAFLNANSGTKTITVLESDDAQSVEPQ